MISEDQRQAARGIAADYKRRGKDDVSFDDKTYGKNLYVRLPSPAGSERRWRIGPRDTVMEIRRAGGSWYSSGTAQRHSTKKLAEVYRREGLV